MKSEQILSVVRQDLWTCSKGSHSGKPLIVRVRRDFAFVTDRSGYPTLLKIVWTFEADRAGMPDRLAAEAMEQFENRVVPAFEHDCHAVLTAVVTTHGTRLWIFYTSDVDECADRLSAANQEQTCPIELLAREDREWSFLREKMETVFPDKAA